MPYVLSTADVGGRHRQKSGEGQMTPETKKVLLFEQWKRVELERVDVRSDTDRQRRQSSFCRTGTL